MKKHKNNYWTLDMCHNEALKYNKRIDFSKSSCGAYKSAWRNKWLDEICKHMTISGDLYQRYNYIYEFSDNHVYIGLTCNIKRRKSEHLINKNSPVYKHIKKTNLIPNIIYDNLKNVKLAQQLESELLTKYKENGWIILNKAKSGSLGYVKISWNKEKCIIEALKYKSRIEFKQNSRSAYRYALTNKIINDVCSHMKTNWTLELCIKEVLKYRSKREWSRKSCKSYYAAKKNNWINECVRHFKPKLTKEKCIFEALKYKKKLDFCKHSNSAYQYSYRNGFLNEICEHMVKHK